MRDNKHSRGSKVDSSFRGEPPAISSCCKPFTNINQNQICLKIVGQRSRSRYRNEIQNQNRHAITEWHSTDAEIEEEASHTVYTTQISFTLPSDCFEPIHLVFDTQCLFFVANIECSSLFFWPIRLGVSTKLHFIFKSWCWIEFGLTSLYCKSQEMHSWVELIGWIGVDFCYCYWVVCICTESTVLLFSRAFLFIEERGTQVRKWKKDKNG